MEIQVDFQSGIPLVNQIAHQVMELIRRGELDPGEQLPTTRTLAVKLGINFNTVARAYRLLDQAGIISTQPGRGTFVIDPKEDQVPAEEKTKHIRELTRFYLDQASNLGFNSQEIRNCFERMVKEEDVTQCQDPPIP